MARCRGAPRIDSTGGGFDQRTSCPLLPPPTGMRDPADHVAPDLGHGGGRRAVGRNHPGRQGYRRRRPASRHLCDRAVRSPSPFRRLLSRRFFVPRHWQPGRPAARSFEALRDAAPRLPGCRHHQRPGRAPVECLASTPAGRRSAADGGTAMRRHGGLARAARSTRFCPGMGQRQGVPPYPLRDSRPLATPRSRCWASRPHPMSTGHLYTWPGPATFSLPRTDGRAPSSRAAGPAKALHCRS